MRTGRVMPVYLVVDVSYSMSIAEEQLNSSLSSLLNVLRTDPLMAELVRLSLIAFSEMPVLLARLSSVEEMKLPWLRPSGGTRYGPAISMLARTVQDDIAALQNSGYAVYRPLVFFISDGSPMDPGWQVELRELRDQRRSPTIIAIGFGSADPQALRLIAGGRGRAFIFAEHTDAKQAIESTLEFAGAALQSTVLGSTKQEESQPIALPSDWIDVTEDGPFI